MRWGWIVLGLLGGAWLLRIYLLGYWPALPIDHSVFWGAGQRVLEGRAGLVYDGPVNDAYLGALHGTEPRDGLRFPYFPSTLLFVWPLGFLPFWLSWTVFVGVGLGAVFYIVRRLTDSVIAAGAVFALGGPIHAIQLGQNGFYSAALLGGGLLALRRYPTLAGIALGLLTFKPHLALVAFFVLLWWREWRAFAWACGTAGTLVILPALVWGPDIYTQFFAGNTSFLDTVAEKRDTLIETMHQSVFATALKHGTIATSLAIHAGVAMIALVILMTVRQREMAISAAIAATLLVSPYSLLYDSTMLLIACALLIRVDRRWILPMAGLIGLTGIWFVTLASAVPLGALVILLAAKFVDMRLGDSPVGEARVKTPSLPGSASA